MKTILVTVSDDRFGRKEGGYRATQEKIVSIVKSNPKLFKDVTLRMWTFDDVMAHRDFYEANEAMLSHADAALNGRLYKPFVIKEALDECEEGDYVIYNDCSPELWEMPKTELNLNLDKIKYLCMFNKDILTGLVEWDTKPIPKGEYGIHTHHNFTTNRCMKVMKMEQYRYHYMHASGMIVLRKSKRSVDFVDQWLFWNRIDSCASLGRVERTDNYDYWAEEENVKMGHRHDQSISGLLICELDNNLIRNHSINGLNPWNFLNYCDPQHEYEFVSTKPIKMPDPNEIVKGSRVVNQMGQELKVFEIVNESGQEWFIVGKHTQSRYKAKRSTLTLVK